MPPVTFLIKPASSACNLRCKYCFYFSEAEQRTVPYYGMMSEETLEAVVRKGLAYAEGSCGFAFQGGEPMLAGLPFFRKLVELEERHNTKGVAVHNAIQTNGTLVDEEWARFFHDHRFLVGLSLDGDRDTHNLHRVDAGRRGTFPQVLAAARLFDRFAVEYNILTVVTANTARYAGRVYDFYRKNGFRYLQFIHCLDPLGMEPGSLPHSLGAEGLERFLKTLFDRWYEDLMTGQYVSVRYFDNLVQMLLGHPPEACGMAGVCGINLVLESDGGAYPCDFYMLDEWRLGNLVTDEVADLIASARAEEFRRLSVEPAVSCRGCRWFALCRGGCRRERERAAGGLDVNVFCAAYRGFFEYAYPRLAQAARLAAQGEGRAR